MTTGEKIIIGFLVYQFFFAKKAEARPAPTPMPGRVPSGGGAAGAGGVVQPVVPPAQKPPAPTKTPLLVPTPGTQEMLDIAAQTTVSFPTPAAQKRPAPTMAVSAEVFTAEGRPSPAEAFAQFEAEAKRLDIAFMTPTVPVPAPTPGTQEMLDIAAQTAVWFPTPPAPTPISEIVAQQFEEVIAPPAPTEDFGTGIFGPEIAAVPTPTTQEELVEAFQATEPGSEEEMMAFANLQEAEGF